MKDIQAVEKGSWLLPNTQRLDALRFNKASFIGSNSSTKIGKMTLAYDQIDSYVIHYRLIKESHSVKLKLWEPTTAYGSNQAAHPYLYAANFNFRHIREAEDFLRNHLLVNGAMDVPEAGFPEEGQAAILPFPTWGIDK